MKISFFEEFPNKKNLEKLRLVNWPTTVYVAAKNMAEFEKIRRSVKNKKVEIGYWPILEKKEGYWLSPFSFPPALKRVIKEISSCQKQLKIMWDAELPLRHSRLLFRIDYFLRNKPRIKQIFKEKGKSFLTSEYPIKNDLVGWILTKLGVSFSPNIYGNKKIVMYYTSMHKLIKNKFLDNIKRLQKRYNNNLQVGLGTIATGILCNEPILSAESLERDLQKMKQIGIKEVVIFRLGGLDQSYSKILKKYV